jgi:hypothetical protein
MAVVPQSLFSALGGVAIIEALKIVVELGVGGFE